MAILTAGLTARAALPNLHKPSKPLSQLLLSCPPKKEGVRRGEEEEDKRKLICWVLDLNSI